MVVLRFTAEKITNPAQQYYVTGQLNKFNCLSLNLIKYFCFVQNGR